MGVGVNGYVTCIWLEGPQIVHGTVCVSRSVGLRECYLKVLGFNGESVWESKGLLCVYGWSGRVSFKGLTARVGLRVYGSVICRSGGPRVRYMCASGCTGVLHVYGWRGPRVV